MSELYRALGSYDDAPAIARLVEAAKEYVERGDNAEGTLHKAAFWQLLKRSRREASGLIASYLARFDPFSRLADQWTCINAILAAGRLGLSESHDVILRLVGELGIGYYTNEEHRGPLLRVLWQTGGDRAYPAVRALLDRHYSSVRETEPGSDEWAKQKHDESCLVATLHMMRPDDPSSRATFVELAASYAALRRTVSPLCFYGMNALLHAIQVAKIPGHEATVEALANHQVRPKYDHLEPLAQQVRQLARSLQR